VSAQVFVLTVEASGEVTPAPAAEPEAEVPSSEEELTDG
jgi:hypothetical protein